MLPAKKPKIAILSLRNTYEYGGVLSSLRAMYDFCELYFEPTVFFLGFDPEISTSLRSLKCTSSHRPLIYFGMKCVEVGARWAFWEPGHYKFTIGTWKKLLSDYDYFVAVSGTCIVAHPLMLLNKKYGLLVSTPFAEDRSERLKELSGVRAFIDHFSHGRMNVIEKKILSHSDFIWALSNYSMKNFKNIAVHSMPESIRCGHPIDCSVLPLLEEKQERVIVALGRFNDPRKNIPMLLRVFEKIYHTMPDAKLYIVGQRPADEKIAAFSHLDSFDNVVFVGQVSSADLNHMLNIAQLMLITSYQEGFGIAGLEALWHGIPIVSTRCGGPQDYVIENNTGFLIDINDDSSMAAKSLAILSSDVLRNAMAHNAQKFVQSNFSTQQVHEYFKRGFIHIHPELKDLFDACAGEGSITQVDGVKNHERSRY